MAADLSIFNKKKVTLTCNPTATTRNNQDIVGNCSYLQRLITALIYYHKLTASDENEFIQFCIKNYSTQCVDDYIHFLSKHREMSDIQNIVASLEMVGGWKECEGPNECQWTNRHYASRTKTQRDVDGSYHFYIDIFDTIHFYLYHMQQLALRIAVKNENETEEKDGKVVALFDKKIDFMQKEIEKKAKKWNVVSERLDNVNNKKFNIMANYNNQEKKSNVVAKSKQNSGNIWGSLQNRIKKYFVADADAESKRAMEEPFLDEMFVYILAELGVGYNAIMDNLNTFFVADGFDTDAVMDDVAIYNDAEEKQCNIALYINDDKLLKSIVNFIAHKTISAHTFSTGITFFYWPWYKNANYAKIKHDQYYYGLDNDFGGYSVHELYVKPHYKSIKEEVLQSGFIAIAMFKSKVIGKGNIYFAAKRCKKIKCVQEYDPLHFGIKYGAKLEKSHLYAIILYCDFTEFCTDFSSSFRKNEWNETIKQIRDRNSKYARISKQLRECIQYYGINGSGNKNGKECGPFFTGMSFLMNIGEFSMRLHGPTSTTKTKEIAIRFAGSSGILIVLNNGSKWPGGHEIFFDSSWISSYPEEDERLWFAMRRKMEIQSIIVMQTQNNYRKIIKAYYKFDALLSGQDFTFIQQPTKKDYSVIKSAISYILDEAKDSPSNIALDQYSKQNFYSFTRQKTMISLNLDNMDEVDNRLFSGLIMHCVQNREHLGMPKDATNLFRGLIFKLFPYLKEILIYSSSYLFSPLSLLSVLTEYRLPQSFKRVIIKDTAFEKKWIHKAFDVHVQNAFIAETFNVELKRDVEGAFFKEDWMTITVN